MLRIDLSGVMNGRGNCVLALALPAMLGISWAVKVQTHATFIVTLSMGVIG